MKLFMRIFLMAVLSSAVGYVTVVNAAEEWRGEDGLSWGADISDYGVVITRIPVQTKGTVAIPASLRVPTGAENSEEGFEEDDVVELDEAALDGCRYVTEFSVGTDNDYFRAVDGVLYDADVSVLIRCPPGKTGRLEIPDTVFEIAESAFFLSARELPR